MSSSISFDSMVLTSIAQHVFMPPKLPQEAPGDEAERQMNMTLCHILIQSAQVFLCSLPTPQQPIWVQVIKMLEFVELVTYFPLEKYVLESILSNMLAEDVFVMHVRAQNAGLVIRRLRDTVRFEMFELSPRNEDVMSTEGKLLCSYPGPAIQVSTDTFLNHSFLSELASFLVQMDVDDLASEATLKAGSTVTEVRESAHPRYITELLCGILRGFGEPAKVKRITKRINDEVLWKDAYKPWRRSPLWLVLRVALQTTLGADGVYKSFMLFFHAEVLRLCTKQGLPSDLLHAMRCKVARRLCKIEPSVPSFVFQAVREISVQVNDVIQARWKKHQDRMSVPLDWHPGTLDFDADTTISLTNAYDYIDRALRPSSQSHSRTQFKPSLGKRFDNHSDFRQFTDGRLTGIIEEHKHIALMDFELSVEVHLDSWIDKAIHDDDAPEIVASCIDQYLSGAKDLYGSNPEDSSVMILTILDLWMALDVLATSRCPLLRSYSPVIPRGFLQPLLLHRDGSLRRATLIERYLLKRHTEATNTTSIFTDSSETCFAVKYYLASPSLQRLHQEIKLDAQRKRAEKVVELKSLNEKFKSLNAQAAVEEHRYSEDRWGEQQHLTESCMKCMLSGQAERLKIGVHEWPLPSVVTEAQSAVFELRPPRVFSTWRSMTFMILNDVGICRDALNGDPQDQPKILLDAFSGLQPWATYHPYHRITLGSTTKPFIRSHYKRVRIPTEQSSVCVNNGLSFRLFDRSGRSWAAKSFISSSVAGLCSPPEPTFSPYAPIHFSVLSIDYTSNEAIAEQANCPEELGLHEYIAFTALRSGPLLQWLNIAREIASPSLSFRKEEVHTLITQAAWQLGPYSAADIFEWHRELHEPIFCRDLLRELDAFLEKIQMNWLEEVSVRTVVLVACRLLASKTVPEICKQAHALLRKARSLTYKWLREISTRLDATQDELLLADFRRRLCTVGATCLSTFDVGHDNISGVLSSDSDLSIAIHCAVVVYENKPAKLTESDSTYLSRLLGRHRRLLHSLEPGLRRGTLLTSSGYDLALASLYPAHWQNSTGTWTTLSEPNNRWVRRLTQGGQEVHLNILTGELLVDGMPVGRLPQDIMDDPTYNSIFGSKALSVAPADRNGMDLMTRSNVHGYQVLFSRRNGAVVLQLRASCCYQIVPRSILSGDFPVHLVEGHVHWLDLETGEIEFRPVDSLWTTDATNWRLAVRGRPGDPSRSRVMFRQLSGSDESKTLVKLIDIRSKTFQMVSNVFNTLEVPERVIVARIAGVLEVTLVRLRLSFFSNPDRELECQNMPGYVVDECQSSGTMFGLQHRLILRPSLSAKTESTQYKRLIIPWGDVSFSSDGDFAIVSIKTGAGPRVRWHEYTIDADLGCLRGNASLEGRLYRCYLHAVTSHCLPDPLLRRTGTEEALDLLQSAYCKSFRRLGNSEAQLLGSIAGLTPRRTWYPAHLQSMSSIKWKDLPSLAQHEDFHIFTSRIFDHALAVQTLYNEAATFDTPKHRDSFLSRRAHGRRETCYPSKEPHATENLPLQSVEARYTSRETSFEGTAGHTAYVTAQSVLTAQPNFDGKRSKLRSILESWGSVGPATPGISLKYSRYWLDFDASRDWLGIYELCLKSASERNPEDVRTELAFTLSAATYSQTCHAKIIPIIAILATDKRLDHLALRRLENHYSISDGTSPQSSHLSSMISGCALSISLTPAQHLPVAGKKSKRAKQRQNEYTRVVKEKSAQAAQSMVSMWPRNEALQIDERWFDKPRVRTCIDEYFASISRNVALEQHIQQLQAVLSLYESTSSPSVPYSYSPRFVTVSSNPRRHSISRLLAERSDVSRTLRYENSRWPHPYTSDDNDLACSASSSIQENDRALCRDDAQGLDGLIEELLRSRDPLVRLYGGDLKTSYAELARHDLNQGHVSRLRGPLPSHEILTVHRDSCARRLDAMFSGILATLLPQSGPEQVVSLACLWPRITPRTILGMLANGRTDSLTDRWKSHITRYATMFLEYQQSQRMLELSLRGRAEELRQEIEVKCEDIVAASSPEWLLVQIEANVLARPLQLSIARQMIAPTSQRNMSLQLNMGEGKSSVIVPLVSVSLANGSSLVRIVTLKPLSNQMFQLLVGRLAGDLTNRPIFYLPFSRNLRVGSTTIHTIRSLYERCIAEGGVLVVQPEHMLSQKLMCIDYLLTSGGGPQDQPPVARELKALEDWLSDVSRDVLDESDEILHVRYQLVYTVGEQMPVQDHPDRWTTIQQVFGRLHDHAVRLRARFPSYFELDGTQRGFPIIRILDRALSETISSLIAEDALRGALPNLSLAVLPPKIRGAALRFMTRRDVSAADRNAVFSRTAGTSLWNGLLLLRGLLMDGDGILGYALKERRWRVDFGLDPTRTLLAVPYRAKDVPSIRAEFGHPDVAIALTCLSYYYGGLTKSQVLQCFDFLFKLDNPELEYESWVHTEEDVPEGLHQLSGVNTKDETQISDFLVPLFSRNERAVNFYLSQVVFPRAAKEFPSKLSTSGWDLVEPKTNVTTGFSGTNDNRFLLPTSITQEDHESQLSTNALVLQYLLQPENHFYECTQGEAGQRESAETFLKRLVAQDPEIRVLLDVGAQMLELQNKELVQCWLSLRSDVSAAIFFNDADDLTVLTRDGMTELLISSPFSRQLGKCVVYLDEAHTRGTDLKLPRETRAAVTLGPKVTKDRLLQACMRMRQLGKGQSVMFFAPGEVDRRIRDLIPNGSESCERIEARDILRWAIHETCTDIRHHVPHWVEQGLDHHRRSSAYTKFNKTGAAAYLKNSWLQPEAQSLEQMYDPILRAQSVTTQARIGKVPALRERMEYLGVLELTDVRMAEEQEREVNHEVERERQVERPSKVVPAKHQTHQDIRTFVRTGKVPSHSTYISPLFAPIGIAQALDLTTRWSPSPLATVDFTTTTMSSRGGSLSDYMRPVNWILSSGSEKDDLVIIVISPQEANELLPEIRSSKVVRLHVYAPRVAASMRSFSDLTSYCVPALPTQAWSAPTHIRTELNLWAGQLYFDSKAEYEQFCALLALHMAHPGAKYIEVDGFVPPEYRTGEESPFDTSKLAVFKTLVRLRRKGMGFAASHLGRVLDARPLGSDDFEL
ncbi:hypothetical protein BC834DRAFT_853041 [Gloeopeniophorella convolvens]|nr:hypothetical protein BC834DRAFT_853041 [Gloeopeniophorella convolvens]